MDYILQFQLSIYATVALLMLLVKIYYKEEVYSYSNRLFRAMAIGAILIMAMEFLSWFFDGKSGSFNYVMNYAFNFLLFVCSALVPGFWASYIHYKIFGDKEKVRKLLWFQFPLLIALLLAVINLIHPIIFDIPTDTNLFIRLPLISINYIMVYGLVIYTVVMAIKERSKLKRIVLSAVLLFVILSFLSSLLQVLNYGLIVMYPMLALSIIVIYLFLETTSSATDYLTGLYSRSRFDEYLMSKVEKNEEFTVVMLDLDDYKQFNDEHGHVVGDRILIMYANLMKQAFGEKSLVARYGGDEFVVVIPDSQEESIMKYKEKISKGINKSSDKIFRKVRFAYGFSTRTKENQYGYDKLLKESDEVMYSDKSINKNFLRRKEDKKKAKLLKEKGE